ncbi:MAG: demethoxyubiquinone hydroxylase family protein [Limnobacter sp.]|nr:demethoxyubiquinone hydroxylase family protein [Limnobacter sp.]
MNATTVFFDGSCPLCRREIGLYRGLQSSQPIDWVDVSSPDAPEVSPRIQQTGKTSCDLMARFHVQTGQGELLNGAQAFVHIWQLLPGWRWLARLAAIPGMLWMMERMYNGFLKVRPGMQNGMRWWAADDLPPFMISHLRTDHAGEVGAVWIYKGMLAGSRDPQVREFAQRHLKTEQEHLRLMKEILPILRRTKLVPIWMLAGFLTGFLPALAGRRAAFATVEAVETFVDRHYEEQCQMLEQAGHQGQLLDLLRQCQGDEVAHRDEAAALAHSDEAGRALDFWKKAVGGGSAAAVKLTRLV